MELVQGEWRQLNTESPDDDEQAAKLWARRGGGVGVECGGHKHGRTLSVICDCRTRVRQACSRTVCSDVPDDDTKRMRAELEGIAIGCEDVEQQAARFQRLAVDPCVNLVGFSDGSLSGDGNNGGCTVGCLRWWRLG
jgi:hypothetical protein